MSTKRIYFLLCAAAIASGLSIFVSAYVMNALLQKKSNTLVEAKLENRLLDEQQTALVNANRTIAQYQELNNIAKSVVPQDKDQAEAVRQIVKIANESGVKLGAITFPASALGQSGKNSNSVTQVKPVSGIPGLFTLEVTVQQDNANPTTYPKLVDFLSRLENNRRTAQVTSVTVQPVPQNRNVLNFSLTLNTYIKP